MQHYLVLTLSPDTVLDHMHTYTRIIDFVVVIANYNYFDEIWTVILKIHDISGIQYMTSVMIPVVKTHPASSNNPICSGLSPIHYLTVHRKSQ